MHKLRGQEPDRTVQLVSQRHSGWGQRAKVLEGHENWVSSVTFSPDGSQIVSGSNDHTVRIWDTTTGEALATLKGHDGSVSSVAFSPDGSQIVSGSWDRTVRIWDTTTGEAVATLKGYDSSVYSVAFSPDGSQIVSRSLFGAVLVWNAITGSLISGEMAQDVRIKDPGQSIFQCDNKTGWLSLIRPQSDKPLHARLCWIPFARRPHDGNITSHGSKVVMGSKSGIVTILDCSLHPAFSHK
jgi:WD40 repeat protein